MQNDTPDVARLPIPRLGVCSLVPRPLLEKYQCVPREADEMKPSEKRLTFEEFVQKHAEVSSQTILLRPSLQTWKSE
jgi:hypothetical protein